MATPIRDYGGQLFGGHDKPCEITSIVMIPTDTTVSIEMELEVMDWDYTSGAYTPSRVDRAFHMRIAPYTAPVFDFSKNPIRCAKGISVATNTNCRPIFYIK